MLLILGVWSKDLYIRAIYHDEIIPFTISNFLDTFIVNRNIGKYPRERPKWAKENGKHYIYFHGRSGSGKGHTFRPVGSRKDGVILLQSQVLLSTKQTCKP